MRILMGAVTALAALVLTGCSGEESAPAARQPDCLLSVGWDPWEPYQYQANDGSVQGLDVEIIRLLAADAKCELAFVQGNWLDLLHQLRDGRVQVLLAATVVPERQAYAWFSPPYREESFALFVRDADLEGLAPRNLRQLVADGRRIGFTEGYYYGEEVHALATDPATAARFVPASVVELNYSRLLDRSIDVLIDDPIVAADVIRRKGWSGEVVRHPQVVASGHVSLMFSRSTVAEAVVRRFDQSLLARRQDGSLGRITAKYEN